MRVNGLLGAVVAALWLLTVITASADAASWQWIAPQRVHGLQREGSGLWLVDVRTPAAFEGGHIEGALNVPVDLLGTRNLPRTKSIVLADDSLGLRKALAGAETLLKKGYGKVFIIEGGIPAWEMERLPATGTRGGNLRPVMWEELAWARANAVRLRLYDLRDKEERTRGPVEGARELAGSTLDERLKALTKELAPLPAAKRPAAKLEKPVSTVLVLPSVSQPLDALRTALRGLSGDFRCLDGAYPLWVAREKRNPLPGPEVCPTCPEGRVKK